MAGRWKQIRIENVGNSDKGIVTENKNKNPVLPVDFWKEKMYTKIEYLL